MVCFLIRIQNNDILFLNWLIREVEGAMEVDWGMAMKYSTALESRLS